MTQVLGSSPLVLDIPIYHFWYQFSNFIYCYSMFLEEVVKHVIIFQKVLFLLTDAIISQDYCWNICNLIQNIFKGKKSKVV